MRCVAALWGGLALALAWLALSAWPAPALAQLAGSRLQPTVLRDVHEVMEAQPIARGWLDPRSDATIEQVASRAGLARFRDPQPRTALPLGSPGAIWLHLRLVRGINERQDWLLEFPMPSLDRVTVYQQDDAGWLAETAGDTLAVNRWPEAGRHPTFRLDLPHGQVRDVFVRIRHATEANGPFA